MKEYIISVTQDGQLFRVDEAKLEYLNLFVGCAIKRLMGGADLCRIAEHGFKSVTIREGYFIDIVVG